ncbi:hypothetical protein K431DRAFT_221033 [Polychaeton citri CBS 116435]|uniref:DNA repair protein Rad26 n=1 Tax=Polychaeton citri CBS 116435 TaxID=1314669 RepID=A0A9P4URP3_9PEZI|nr:hypothetical protein K431DRAFT_221033 [Polychaeton citri CBS 116435]
MVAEASSGLPIRRGTLPNWQGGPSHESRYRPVPDPETEAIYAAADAEMGTLQTGTVKQVAPQIDAGAGVAALQAHIVELENKLLKEQESSRQARDTISLKVGEIAIVRENQKKEKRAYERDMGVIQKLHAEEVARHKVEIAAHREERKKVETDNQFLQHNLAQEAQKSKKPSGTVRAGVAPAKALASPRNQALALGDGFADEEIAIVSPSKSKERLRDHTPKAGVKRKRNVNDSPAAPLSFSNPVEPGYESNTHSFTSTETNLPSALSMSKDARYDLTQRVLGHRPHPNHPKTVEALVYFHLPTDARNSLSAMVLEALSNLSDTKEPAALVFTKMLLGLWRRCIQEKYYGPLNLILSLIRFVLDFELPSTSLGLVEEAVPICIASLELVVNPRARAAHVPTFAATLNHEEMVQRARQIQVGEICDFLLYLAQASTLRLERNEVFWKLMNYEFTNTMINKVNPLEQVIVALQILRTSCRHMSFGVIVNDARRQADTEHTTISLLTFLLLETPNPPVGEPPYDDDEVAELHLEILKVIEDLCTTSHGSLLIAQHHLAVGRLFQALEGFVRKLHLLSPSLRTSKASNKTISEQNAHDLVIQCINLVVRLLSYVLRTHSDLINLQQKLSAVHGGYHKFLVGLTRVAFTEQLVIDAGIDNEVIEAAHSILDNVLSPEEGEAVVKALETPRGTTTSYERTRPNSTDDGNDTAIVDAPS